MEAPTQNELVLFCCHAKIIGEEIYMDGPIEWYRPAGGESELVRPVAGTVRFIALCQRCHLAAKGKDPMAFVGQHGYWSGKSPKIERIQ